MTEEQRTQEEEKRQRAIFKHRANCSHDYPLKLARLWIMGESYMACSNCMEYIRKPVCEKHGLPD